MIGQLEKVTCDETGAPAWLVVSEFRLGEGRRFVIPIADAVGCEGRIWSPHPREQIRASATLAGPVFSAEADRELRSLYRGARRVA